jgi:hypothetical protein
VTNVQRRFQIVLSTRGLRRSYMVSNGQLFIDRRNAKCMLPSNLGRQYAAGRLQCAVVFEGPLLREQSTNTACFAVVLLRLPEEISML